MRTMVLEYLPTLSYIETPKIWPSYVGKYSSTMVRIWESSSYLVVKRGIGKLSYGLWVFRFPVELGASWSYNQHSSTA